MNTAKELLKDLLDACTSNIPNHMIQGRLEGSMREAEMFLDFDEVHCLKCDHVFPEESPISIACPNCGNADTNQTAYLQKENS